MKTSSSTKRKDFSNFSLRLASTRKLARWSAIKLADETNSLAGIDITSRDIITRTENGLRKTIPISEALLYAQCLHVKASTLLFSGDNPQEPSPFVEYQGLTNQQAKKQWVTKDKKRVIPVQAKRTNLKNISRIEQYNSNGQLVNIFQSTYHAATWLQSHGHPHAAHNNIVQACIGKRKTAYGFSWSYL